MALFIYSSNSLIPFLATLLPRFCLHTCLLFPFLDFEGSDDLFALLYKFASDLLVLATDVWSRLKSLFTYLSFVNCMLNCRNR